MTYVDRQKSIAWTYNSLLRSQAVFDIDDSNPSVAEMIQNNLQVGVQQPGRAIPAGRVVELGFSTEFRGSDVASTGPPEHVLWMAAGMAETGTTGKTYTEGDTRMVGASPAGDVTVADITLNTGGAAAKTGRAITAKSAVLDVSLILEAGKIGYMIWKVLGQIDGAAATPTSSAFTEANAAASFRGPLPVPVQGASASVTLSTAGALSTPIIHSMKYNLGNVLSKRPSFNATDSGFGPPIINGREPTAEIIMEAPQGLALETGLWVGETIAFSMTHNVGGGIREECTVSFTGTYKDAVKIGEQDNAATYIISLDGTTAGPLTIAYAAS